MKYYTDLTWARMVKEAMGKEQEPMQSMYDILNIPGAEQKCRKILVEGKYLIK